MAYALPRFGLNRFDASSVDAFATDVARAEALGWDAAFQPDSQLRRRDTYVLLAAAARATNRITLGPLIANPVNRHPSVTASSIATIDELAPGRTLLGYGVGDTAVRLAGLRPARVRELEAATTLVRRLLAGEDVEVGAERPARLPHARSVPVWIAAAGPRTLRMAGGVADGVFIRAGTSPGNIDAAVAQVKAGAAEAGRNPAEVRFAAVFHAVLVDDQADALTMAKSMAAGYYEYTLGLFATAGLTWDGPSPERLKHEHAVHPDFHHAPDLLASGRAVDFLPEAAAGAFALYGGPDQVAAQLIAVLRSAPVAFDYVVLQPIPNPPSPDDPTGGYMARMAREVLPVVRAALRLDAVAGAFQPRFGGEWRSTGDPVRLIVDRQVHTCLYSGVTDIFDALAAPVRRTILDELADRDGQTLFEICSRLAVKHNLGLSRQAISQHLEVLEAAGLVRTRREGRYKFHDLDTGPLQEILRRWPVSESEGP